MKLQSFLFEDDARLADCLVRDSAHVLSGDRGPHVQKIQFAIEIIDKITISEDEKTGKFFGPSTAAAVLSYKKKRKIINRSYQSTEDNIVGKMTIKSLDDEMVKRQGKSRNGRVGNCDRDNFPAQVVVGDVSRQIA